MSDIEALIGDWLRWKEAERIAETQRRIIEDALTKAFGVAVDLEGVTTKEVAGLDVKITGRITRTVDATKVQELAAEHGLEVHLSSLFRWKPEINAAVWKASADSITRPLLGAITSKPGRPSFAVTPKKES